MVAAGTILANGIISLHTEKSSPCVGRIFLAYSNSNAPV